jgi:8-hydroxy-5-deazaflavin:NADPH oxidoreductase
MKETLMKIAILGAGKVAHALGAGWRKSGHDVIFGARDTSATDPDFEIIGLQDALAVGDVIVNAITGAAALQAITALDTSAMAGKTLLDATNARTGTGDLVYANSSLAEHLQAALPVVHVVKSLNTAAIEVLADPSLVGPATVFVSGDDEAAKAEVKGLLHDLGWQDEGIIDLGGIKTARGPEHYGVLFFEIVAVLKSRLVNIHVIR